MGRNVENLEYDPHPVRSDNVRILRLFPDEGTPLFNTAPPHGQQNGSVTQDIRRSQWARTLQHTSTRMLACVSPLAVQSVFVFSASFFGHCYKMASWCPIVSCLQPVSINHLRKTKRGDWTAGIQALPDFLAAKAGVPDKSSGTRTMCGSFTPSSYVHQCGVNPGKTSSQRCPPN